MSEHPALVRIRADITNSPIVLFMEGTPMFPHDGASAAVAQFLALAGLKACSFNLRDEPDLHEGLTYLNGTNELPQLYIQGRFVGAGLPLRTAIKTGELQRYLIETGLLQG